MHTISISKFKPEFNKNRNEDLKHNLPSAGTKNKTLKSLNYSL